MMVVAALAAAGLVVTQAIAFKRARQLSDAQTLLASAKERESAEAIAGLNKETARLKNENLKLAERIAVTGHRNSQIFAVQSDMASHLSVFAGQKFELGICSLLSLDMEVRELYGALGHTLELAKWVRLPAEIEAGFCSAGVIIFVRPTAPESTKRAAHKLTELLDAALGKVLLGNKEAGQVGMAEVQPPPPGARSPAPSENDAILIVIGSHP